MNLKSLLEDSVRRFGKKTAIVIGEHRVSFAQINEDSNRVAHALREMGVKKGDRVAMIQSSNLEFVTVFFGIMKAGGIAVPFDYRYVVEELASLCDDCRPKVLVTENPPLETLLPVLRRFNSIERVITLDPAYEDKFTAYHEILAGKPSVPVDAEIDSDDIAIISYTGGPTQKPLGAAISHRSICIEVANSAGVFQQTEGDTVMLFALPMHHQFGLVAVMLASILKGSTLVIVPGTGRSIQSFMETVERKKGSIYMGVPYIYSLMINVARREGVRHDLSSLRLCISSGAPIEPVVINLFKKYYSLDVLDIYGQTEAICQITTCPIDNSAPVGSSGKPMPCWEIKIFDENDNELPPRCEGEIVVRGPVMTGFYNNPEATSERIRKGWLHTGDIGRLDKDGFLFITGRKRRLIILKGQNVFPADIEEVLLAHPKIAEVKVQGVCDLIRGETVRALVRLEPGEIATEQEIRHYCQGRMADYKLPREVRFLETLPAVIPIWKRMADIKAAGLMIEESG